MSITRIKIPRTTLIERVQEKIDKARKKYDEEMAKYEAAISKAAPALLKEVSELSSRLSAMSTDELAQFMSDNSDNSWRRGPKVVITTKTKIPTKPILDVRHAERALRILEASTDETISVGTRDEWFQYL